MIVRVAAVGQSARSAAAAIATVGLALVCAACGSDASPAEDTADAAQGGEALSCEGAQREEPSSAQPFANLNATVVDQDGAVAVLDAAQVCGFDICLLGTPEPTGDVKIGDGIAAPIRGPAFKYGGGVFFAQFAYTLPANETFELLQVKALRLPDISSGSPLAAGSTIESSGVELTIEPDTEIEINELVFRDAKSQAFRAVLAKSFETPAIPADLGLELVIGTTPVGTTFCPPASLSVENTLGWAAGTSVEILVHGVHLDQRFAPYGGWASAGFGSVNEQGTRIELPGGVPELSVLGLRRASRASP